MGKVTPTSEVCHGRCQKRTHVLQPLNRCLITNLRGEVWSDPVDLVNFKQGPVCRFTYDQKKKKNHRESRENVYKLPKTKKAVQMLSLGDNWKVSGLPPDSPSLKALWRGAGSVRAMDSGSGWEPTCDPDSHSPYGAVGGSLFTATFFFLAVLLSLQDLSSPIRDRTRALCSRSSVLITGPPGKSLAFLSRAGETWTLSKHLVLGA